MKRRGFLGLIGAAIATPLMPAMGAASGYTRAGYAAALAHAQRYPLISLGGMVKRLGLPKPEAEAIIAQMSSDGLLGAVNPHRPGTLRAASKVYTGQPFGAVRKAQPTTKTQAAQHQPSCVQPRQTTHMKPVTDPMLAYLQNLCRAQGMTLSHRCFA